MRTFGISLHGLLDYDETDRDEQTFELSVFAESFYDMLSREYGLLVAEALQAARYGIPFAKHRMTGLCLTDSLYG